MKETRGSTLAAVVLLAAMTGCGAGATKEPAASTPSATVPPSTVVLPDGGGADGPPTVLGAPPPSCGAVETTVTPGPGDAIIEGWPSTSKNPSGVYSWDGPGPIGNSTHLEGFMHNGYSRSPGEVSIYITAPDGFGVVPGRLVPHDGRCVIVAGHEGTYRRFTGRRSLAIGGRLLDPDDVSGEWIVDIRGTTIAITLAVDPRTPETEVAEALGIIDSMYADPEDSALGFRLVFTIPTDTWDSG